MKKICVLFVILLILLSCGSLSYLPEDFTLEGVFINKKRNWIELQFKGNEFVYYDGYKQLHMNPEICCDTLSYGTWKMDSRGFAVLETPIDFDLYIMKPIEVVERKDFSPDSLYFIIKNPIEEFYVRNNWKSGDLGYRVFLFSQGGFYNVPEKDQIIFTNKIVASKKPEVKGFEITTLINPELKFNLSHMATSLIVTEPYQLKDPTANVFEIYIPDVNFEFVSLKRLKSDYIKIVNRNKLLWHGEEYVRKR